METDKALWGTVILFAAAFGYPALTIWFAHMKHGLKPDERKNNVGEEAKTGQAPCQEEVSQAIEEAR